MAAGAVLVATGSRPMHPAGIPFDDPDVYDSDQIYSIPRPPENIVIIGGGPEGVEFASAFTALGVPVTQQPIDEADQHGRRTGRADGRRVTPTYSYAYHDATLDGLTRLTEMMGLADGTATMPADTPKATRTDTPKAMAPTPPE